MPLSSFLKLIFLISIISFPLISVAQNAYMDGYIILSDGTRVDGLVKNVDWKYNPETIKFKKSSEDAEMNYTPEELKEFGVATLRYGSFEVEIDETPEDHKFLTAFRQPDNKIRRLFLKYVVDAEVDLLQYKAVRFDRYYYKKPQENEAIQLIYKRYYGDGVNVAENNFYKQQLLNEVNCGNQLADDLERLRYTERNLMKYFQEYNACAYGNTIIKKKDNRLKVQLAARVGVERLKLTVWSYEYDRLLEFPTSLSPLVGFEGEIFSNFNRGKWSLLIGGAHHKFSEELTIDGENYRISYPSLEWTLGYRYYMHLNKDLSLYLNAMIIVDSPLRSTFTLNDEQFLDITSRHFFGLGGGIKLTDRLKVDARVSLEHEILTKYKAYFSDYSGFALTATYVLIRTKPSE